MPDKKQPARIIPDPPTHLTSVGILREEANLTKEELRDRMQEILNDAGVVLDYSVEVDTVDDLEDGSPWNNLHLWHAYVEACGGELFLQARFPAATQDIPAPESQTVIDLAVGRRASARDRLPLTQKTQAPCANAPATLGCK